MGLQTMRARRSGPAKLGRVGFGTLEAVIALTIFTLGLLALIATAAHARSLMNRAHRRSAATAEARLQLEALLAQPYDSLVAGSATRNGVEMGWTIAGHSRAKEIVFSYSYVVRGITRTDTLAAALRRS